LNQANIGLNLVTMPKIKKKIKSLKSLTFYQEKWCFELDILAWPLVIKFLF
jgi:hypothetical protein